MTITIKQLAALAEEFNFDLADARRFLGHTEPQKRGRPTSTSDERTPKVCRGQKCSNDTPRGKTGYQLYMAEFSTRIGAELKQRAEGGKLARGAVASEVGKRWKALDERYREKFITRAKHM